MGNARIFPSISHNMGKCNETHCMGKVWEIGTHSFPIVWVLFPSDSHPMVYFIIWEMHEFPHQFPILQNARKVVDST